MVVINHSLAIFILVFFLCSICGTDMNFLKSFISHYSVYSQINKLVGLYVYVVGCIVLVHVVNQYDYLFLFMIFIMDFFV